VRVAKAPAIEAAPRTDLPRHLARLAMVAAVVCFLLQVSYAQLVAKEKAPAWSTTDRVVAALGIGLLLCGTVLAGISLVGAIRTKNYDTGVMALIGLAINGGVLAFIAWYVLIVRPGLPLP
jgi:uncharacterized membrane-anchored protein